MKFSILVLLGSLTILGGCASHNEGASTASVQDEESYVPLGSMIAKKGKRSAEDQTADLQQLQNARITSGTANTGK